MVCCFSMRIANDRSIRGLLHDVEQHYECSNRSDGCAFAQATSALDAATDLSIRLPTCTFNNCTSLGRVSLFLQMLLAILFQSFSTFLNSLNSF